MWTTIKNCKDIDTGINNCFRTASGALKSTKIEALRLETGYHSFQNLGKRRAIN